MPTFAKSGGIWRTATHVFARSGGVSRDCTNVWVKVAGTWRLVFTRVASFLFNPIGGNTDHAGTSGSITVTFNSNGTWSCNGDTPQSGNWATPTTVGIGGGYWVKLHRNTGVVTGANGSISALDTYFNLATPQTYTLNALSSQTRAISGTWSISNSNSDAGLVGSGTLNISTNG